MLRQKSRPYLFSNSLAPSIVGASIKAFEIIEKDKDALMDRTKSRPLPTKKISTSNAFWIVLY